MKCSLIFKIHLNILYFMVLCFSNVSLSIIANSKVNQKIEIDEFIKYA